MTTSPNSPTGPVPIDVSFRPQRWHVEVAVSHARATLPELLDDVRAGGVVYLTRYGKRLAALVPAGVAEHVERLEDDYWSRRAQAASEAATTDDAQPSIPWPQVVAELEAEA